MSAPLLPMSIAPKDGKLIQAFHRRFGEELIWWDSREGGSWVCVEYDPETMWSPRCPIDEPYKLSADDLMGWSATEVTDPVKAAWAKAY